MEVTRDPASAEAQFGRWLDALESACAARSEKLVERLLLPDSYWKDILSLTGAFRTIRSQQAISTAWISALSAANLRCLRPAMGRMQPRKARRAGQNVIEGFFDFDTDQGHGTGFARLRWSPSGDLPQAWLILTTLQSIRGYEERIGPNRPTGVEFSHNFSGDNWSDIRTSELRFDDRDPEVVIVGAGQGGLALGARLRQMGVDVLILEKNPRIGDNWRNRYHSLTLHNEVWANSLPYMPFPDTWPTFVPKDKLAGWLEGYAEFMELNVWTSTEMISATFNEIDTRWTLNLRQSDDCFRVLRTTHLVMAVGGSTGVPNMPSLPGIDTFEGEVLHSSNFEEGATYAGRNVVVYGTGTSGHDVAQELYSNGATSVTMVQRGSTCVISLIPSGTMVYSLYSEGPPDDVDLITAAIPYPVLRDTYQWLTRKTCEIDVDLLTGLRDVGFKLDFGRDNTGFHMMYLRKGGGYYINVGCSELISQGKINIVQDDQVERLVSQGLLLNDHRVIHADLLVLATGYSNLSHGLKQMLGEKIAERVGPIWGFDEYYNMRGMWQKTDQPGLWITGGTLIDARLYSRFLAVQIVAELRRVELPTGAGHEEVFLHNSDG
jgi:hypothetical protein